MGDEEATSLTGFIGEGMEGPGGEAPRVALIVAAHAGDGAEGGQVDFNGEAAGEPAGESAGVRVPPIPTGLVWPGTVIGAVDHGG